MQELQVLHFSPEMCLNSIRISSYQIKLLPGELLENYGKQHCYFNLFLSQWKLSFKKHNINWLLTSRKETRKEEIVPNFSLFAQEAFKVQ